MTWNITIDEYRGSNPEKITHQLIKQFFGDPIITLVRPPLDPRAYTLITALLIVVGLYYIPRRFKTEEKAIVRIPVINFEVTTRNIGLLILLIGVALLVVGMPQGWIGW